MNTSAHRLVVALLATAMLFHGDALRRANGVTYDETWNLAAGHSIFRAGDFSVFSSEFAQPLPILVSYWPAAFGELATSRWRETRDSQAAEPLWEGHLMDRPLIDRARLATLVLVAIPLILLIYARLVRTGTFTAAVLGAGMLAFSPTIAAHASLATTDVCFAFFMLLSLTALTRYVATPDWWNLSLVAITLGLALASKYSAVVLLPVVFGVLMRVEWPTLRTRLGRWRALGAFCLRLCFVASAAFLLWWATYGFGWSPPDPKVAAFFPGNRLDHWLQTFVAHRWVPSPIRGFQYLVGHNIEPGFLLGTRLTAGHWYYFPLAMLMKSTPAELALGLLAFATCISSVRIARGRSEKCLAETAIWIGAALVYGILLLNSPLNAGQRHALPLYVLLFLLAVRALDVRLQARRRVWQTITGALLAAQVTSAVRSSPFALSYFNSFWGGSASGYQLMVDSNVDWGQDLPRVAESLRQQDCGATALVYFGTALPTAYSMRRLDNVQRNEAGCVAISATSLQGVYVPGDAFRVFRSLHPVGRAGHSILIYHMREPAVRAAWQSVLIARSNDPSHWVAMVRADP